MRPVNLTDLTDLQISGIGYNFSNGAESSGMRKEKKINVKKEEWGRKLDYILTILGFLVGFGNIWRFPYVCMKNGGGAFLIPYVLILFLMVVPVYFLEVSLGQFSGKSYRNVWSYCPLIKGIGLGIQVMVFPGLCYYIMLLAWVFNYVYYSFQSPLPWSTCGNEWNTPYCFSFTDRKHQQMMTNLSTMYSPNTTGYDLDNYTTALGNTTYIQSVDDPITSNTNSSLKHVTFQATKGHSAEEEFLQYEVKKIFCRYKVLDISAGLEHIGSFKGHLVLSVAMAWVVVYLCVCKGIKSTGKVVYVTATLPYLLLVTLLVHNLTLPGSLDGVIFFIKPDFKSLLNIHVWLEAAIQVFYSVCTGWGLHITLASYSKFHNNCLRDTFIMAIAGEGTSVFGGFVIFSALGFMAHEANVHLSEVTKSGPGLGFVAYPMALAQMPFPNLWAVLFFIAMITLGLDSQFTITETVYVYFEECFLLMKRKQIIGRACLSMIGIALSFPFCTQAGVYLFQLFDWYLAVFGPFFFTLIECVSVSWFYGAERFSRDVEMMIGRSVPSYIKFCWTFFSPLLLCVLMVTSLVFYVPPTYGDYVYPNWAGRAGLVVSLAPIIPVFITGFGVVYYSPGKNICQYPNDYTLPYNGTPMISWMYIGLSCFITLHLFAELQKLRHSMRPTKNWHPAVDKIDYQALSLGKQGTVTQKVLANLGFTKDPDVL